MKKKIFIGISLFDSGSWSYVSQLSTGGAGHCSNIESLAMHVHADIEYLKGDWEFTFKPLKDYKPPSGLSKRTYVQLNKWELKKLKLMFKRDYPKQKFPDVDISA